MRSFVQPAISLRIGELLRKHSLPVELGRRFVEARQYEKRRGKVLLWNASKTTPSALKEEQKKTNK